RLTHPCQSADPFGPATTLAVRCTTGRHGPGERSARSPCWLMHPMLLGMPNQNASAGPSRPTRRPITLEVLRTEIVATDIVRVWLGGEGFADFEDNGSTEQYVKLLLAPPGVDYAPDEDMAAARTE